MRSRGPRGAAVGRPLVPIAWGTVTWDGGVALWEAASVVGGEFNGRTPMTISPTATGLLLARAHDVTRLHVVVSLLSSTAVYEVPGLRALASGGTGLAFVAGGVNAPYSVTVYEER